MTVKRLAAMRMAVAAAFAGNVVSVAAVTPPVAEYRYIGGTPALFVNGQRYTTMHYWIWDPYQYNTIGDAIGNCRSNGLHVYAVDAAATWIQSPGVYNFSALDTRCAYLLQRDPQAYILISVCLDGVTNPGLTSWNDDPANSGELCRDSNGSADIPAAYVGAYKHAPSFASNAWQALAEDVLRQLIRHVRTNPTYGERVIGYWLAAGSYEWFQWAASYDATHPPVYTDYSEPARAAFASWAQQKYGTDIAAVNTAWKKSYTGFNDIQIPSPAERQHTDNCTFLDPRQSKYAIDFRQYHAESVANVILRLARAVKEETNGQSLCGVFYGYVLNNTGAYRYEFCGHNALAKVLASPDIDFLGSPTRYDQRDVGGGSGFMVPVDSVKLHHKVYIDQADIRTYLAAGWAGQSANLADSEAVLAREFANTLVNGCITQWYDFSLGWTAGDPDLMNLVGKCQRIEAAMANVSRNTMTGATSIAVIVDEKSMYYTDLGSDVHTDMVVRQCRMLCKTGVGYNLFLLDDLQAIPTDYKCYLFLNTFRITDSQKQYIDSALKRDNKVLVWVFAPGITDGDNLSADRVSQITGFSFQSLNTWDNLTVTPNLSSSDTITAYWRAMPLVYGGAGFSSYGPKLVPMDNNTGWSVLGCRVGDGTTNQPGLVKKNFGGWTSIYSVGPNLPAQLIRGIAEYAGVPVVNYHSGTNANDNDTDVTYVGDRVVAVHSLTGGQRTLYFPVSGGTVTELLSGAAYTLNAGAITVTLAARSTSIFSYDPAVVVDNTSAGMGEGILAGTVALAGFGGDCRSVGVTVDVAPTGGGTMLRYYRLLDAGGGFSLSLPNGTYSVGVKAAGYLRKAVSSVQISGGQTSLTVCLPAGDLDGDNNVSVSDLAIVLANMDQIGN